MSASSFTFLKPEFLFQSPEGSSLAVPWISVIVDGRHLVPSSGFTGLIVGGETSQTYRARIPGRNI